MRCTLRISQRGTSVDGAPMSRADAVTYCKRTAGGVTVIDDNTPCDEWKQTCSELRNEGVPIHVRGMVGDFRVVPIPGNAPLPPVQPTRIAPSCTCDDYRPTAMNTQQP